MDFFSAKKSEHLNSCSSSIVVIGMLECRDCSDVDMVFPFIGSLIERATWCSDEAKLTAVHTMNSNLLNYLLIKLCGMIGSKMSSYNLEDNIQKLKAVTKR